MTKQVIVVNKGLNMTKGKMAAQVAHASEAFLTKEFLINPNSKNKMPIYDKETNELLGYSLNICVDLDCYEWITSSYTKVICEVHNEKELQKVIDKAIKNGFIEDKDFFLIKDNCLTELTPEEVDSNGIGRTLTCIGFKPLDDEIAHKISKKFQLYK